jgi:2-keto-4-pentenoate hydratase/2-oxohepta-3-ene-1,7-dioic acid hydratase in catechol pathway
MARIDIKGTAGGGGGSGTVTSVSIATGTTGTNVNATGTVTTSGTLTVNVPVATAVNTGKLTNTDWSTFNAKQAALVSGTNIKTINGSSVLGAGDLAVTGTPAGVTGNIQFNNAGAFGGENNLFWDDTNNRLGVNTTTPGTTLDLHSGADNVASFNRTGSGSAFAQYSLAGTNKWRTGYDNTAGSFVIYDVANTTNRVVVTNTGEFDLQGNKLQNFCADVETLTASLEFNAANSATYNGRVIQMSNACAFTFNNDLAIGFSATFIQTNAFTSTFAGVGSVIVNNRQGHSSNNGQYSVVSIVKINTLQFILGGDTA